VTARSRPGQPGSPEERDGGEHWDAVYRDRGPAGVSWFQSIPAVSLELIESLGLGPDDAVLDVGAGASTLLDALLERGHRDVTALDVSPAALATVRGRARVAAAIADGRAHTLAVDLRAWTPRRRHACWHDRAAFHFLTAATVTRYPAHGPGQARVERPPCFLGLGGGSLPRWR
jgi:SAM-dependent methyltransferase